MKTSLPALAAAIALSVTSSAARADGRSDGWTGTFSVWAGVTRYAVLDTGRNASATEGTKDLLSGNFDTIGGSVVLHHYGWEYGFLYEGTLMRTHAQSAFFTPVFGFGLDFTNNVRLEALVEFGGHHISQIGAGSSYTAGTRAVWLPYVGLRPGVAYRIPVADVRVVVGLSPFVRRDLVTRHVEVLTKAGPDTTKTYVAGGTAYGAVASLGLEL